MPCRKFKDFYRMGEDLGDGSFSVVRACKEKETGVRRAVKCINKSSLNSTDLVNMHREMEVLTELDHPNIVKLIEVFNDDSEMCYMVFELVTGGELFDRIIEKEYYTEEEAKSVVKTIASVLQYCHAKGIAHRDLKPENLLYATDNLHAEIKIADFGFAKFSADDTLMSTMCGTPGYIAPEVIARRPYSAMCDLWSLGVITYILLSGFSPFYDENMIRELEKIRHGEFEYPSPYFDHVTRKAKQFINSLIQVDPGRRLNATEVLDDPWLTEETDGSAPQLVHVASNLSENKARIKSKFKAGVDAILMINRMKK